MAAVAAHQLSQCITCHAWNAELSMVAVCPNNSEVHIYKASPDGSSIWNRIHILQKHDQLVSGIDWGTRLNKIVTVSHDRNSYVWSLEGVEWSPTLVILRLNRAAICVKWSPRENKFAVGSGAKSVCICYYEQDNNWWVSKLIRKKHNSSVTSVAWHPNNVLLATSSADGKCRVFSTFIKGVDTRDSTVSPFCDMKFGEELRERAHHTCSTIDQLQRKLQEEEIELEALQKELELQKIETGHWENRAFKLLEKHKTIDAEDYDSVKSELEQLQNRPLFQFHLEKLGITGGCKLDCQICFFGHSSTIYFIDDVGPSAVAQEVAFRDLPLRDILFLSERMVVGVGFDCNPMLFAADSNGTWSFVKFLDEKKSVATTSKYGSQFSEAFGKFYGQAKHGSNVDSVEPSRAPGGSHENCITCIVPLPHPGETTLRHFSTSGMDGKVVIWELNDLNSHFSQLAL